MPTSRFRGLAAAAAAIVLGAAGASPAAEPPRGSGGVRLYVLDCGVLLYNSLARFGYRKGEITPTTLSDSCYLIEDPGRGTLIWDTGVIPDSLWTGDGAPPKKQYGEGTKPLAPQLAAIGVKPADVTYAAVSHLHWDHVANLYQFSGSTWLVHPWTRDKVAEPGDKYDPSMFEALKGTRTVVLPTDRDYDVFGDGRVVIVQAPGHTPDSAVLLVRLAHHRPVILCGDLYHFRNDVLRDKAMANEDAPVLAASRAKVQALARSLGAEVWIGHDMREFVRLKKAPQFYD